ncbi:MATE family efflux transporter [Iocasia frigidifontis]|uniref:Multidrug export protein MepA n=1 Tax=Iocasia fonsfrigidae TaxID=2682810 RepID=A0A8A7KD93_9FIRM|nr:MATE family efflux transporter [Iocasia fonsfrigidae]QTL99230.1 MATE family efflux transporter [Iocasia fonsfrigidae]
MYKDKKTRMMAEETIPKVLSNMSIPAIIGMLVTAVYNLVDTVFVGRLGILSIGAVTVVFPIFMLLSAFGMTFGMGSASYISRLLGEDKKNMANKVVSTSFIMTSVFGIFLAALGYIFLEAIVKVFGATDTILPYAMEYGSIIILGTIFTINNMNLNSMVRAEGNAKMSMFAMAIGAGLNIILDPIFIFVLNMGVAGAALATVLAQAVSTIILLYYYFSGRSILEINLRDFSPSVKIFTEIIKMGLPTLMRQVLISIAMALLNNTAGYYNDIYVAAIGIINRVFSLPLMVVLGFGQAFQPVAGFNYGAILFDRLLESIRITIKRTTIFCVIMTIIFIVFSRQLISIFSKDTAVIEIAAVGLKYFSTMLPVLGLNVTASMLYQAMGKAVPAGFLSLSRQGIFFIPTLIILSYLVGVKSIFLAQPLADFLTFLVSMFLLIRTYKNLEEKRKNVTREDVSAELV